MNRRLCCASGLVALLATIAAYPVAAPSAPHSRVKAAAPLQEFKLALPGYRYAFPRDHGSHPAYATEWWYYTGHLQSRDGRRFGYQLTWFRTALAPSVKRASAWATRDIMFAHFALTDEKGRRFFFSDRIGRANLSLNGADANKTAPRVWCSDWTLQFGLDKAKPRR